MNGNCLPPLCGFWKLLGFLLPSYAYCCLIEFHPTDVAFSIQQQIQEDPYSDFWSHFPRNPLCSSTLSCKFYPLHPPQTLISLFSTQRECHALPGLPLSVPWPTKDLQVAGAMTGLPPFIFCFPRSQSFTTYCPISENSCFICFSNFSNVHSKIKNPVPVTSTWQEAESLQFQSVRNSEQFEWVLLTQGFLWGYIWCVARTTIIGRLKWPWRSNSKVTH